MQEFKGATCAWVQGHAIRVNGGVQEAETDHGRADQPKGVADMAAIGIDR
jgi:hypothetical protein